MTFLFLARSARGIPGETSPVGPRDPPGIPGPGTLCYRKSLTSLRYCQQRGEPGQPGVRGPAQ